MITETLFSRDGVSASSEQLKQLQTLFPNCFDENGRFLLEKFQSEIAGQTDISREFYEMNWLGKSYAKLLRNLPPETLLCEDKSHNAKPENVGSQNLLIQGDNLDVLKHLKNAYTGKVKMIYIDPPYNTGSDGFVYQDDRKFTPEQLSELAHISLDEATRILNFTAKGSNSHSAWLTFMYPRLYIARDLLKEDGVIFIHIDENEYSTLELLSNEIFGEENNLGTVVWDKRNPKGNVGGIAQQHEFIIAFAKNKEIFLRSGGLTKRKDNAEKMLNKASEFIRKNKGINENSRQAFKEWANDPKNGLTGGEKAYCFIDENGRIYQTVSMAAPDKPETRSHRPLIHPITKKACPVPTKGWRYPDETMNKLLSNDRIVFGKDETSQPRNKYYLDENIQEGFSSLLYFGGNADTLDLPFNNPKPLYVVNKFLETNTRDNDLILDFFAGSGTTAHAVMQLNAEDNGKRQFILVQLPEKTDEKSEAFKAGYKTIFDITKARIEKAAVKIQSENPNIESGFKIYQTTENFRQHSDDEFSLEQATLPFVEHLTDKQMHTLLTTWALNDGALLTDPITEVKLGNYTAYLCDKRLYLLQSGFTSADLLAFIQKLDNDETFNPNRVIVFGENMPSHLQQELNQAINTYSNKKNIALSLIIRN